MQELMKNIEQNWAQYLWVLVGILLTWCVANILVRVVKRLIAASYQKRASKLAPERQRKMETASSVMQSMSKYLIWFLALAAIVGQLGLTSTMNSMLTAAGIGGLALGIGAQSFIKDIVAGLFIVFENQASVGDYVGVSGVTGTIEEISLRTMVVKSARGELHVIPNGAISMLTNYSRADYLAQVDISVAYEADMQRAMDCMLNEAEEYAKESDNTMDAPQVLGVTALGNNGVTLRLVMKVKPLTHWATERALLERVKRRFDAEKIAIPHNTLVFTGGELT